MKKVICSFGLAALFAGFVWSADAMHKLKGVGQAVRGEKRLTERHDAATGKIFVTDLESGITYEKKNTQELRAANTPSASTSKSTILSSNTPTPRTQRSQLNASRSSFLSPSSSYIASSSQVSNQSKSGIIPTISRDVPEASSLLRSAFQELQDIQQKQIESLERKLEHLSNEQQALIK